MKNVGTKQTLLIFVVVVNWGEGGGVTVWQGYRKNGGIYDNGNDDKDLLMNSAISMKVREAKADVMPVWRDLSSRVTRVGVHADVI